MSMEQYKPSEEEMKKAEESMTEEQKIESEVRKNYEGKRQESGIRQTGDAEYKSMRSDKIDTIEGSFNGHEVSITKHADRTPSGMHRGSYSYIASVDGVPLTSEEANQLGERIFSYADIISAEEHEASSAVREFEKSERVKMEQKKFEDSRAGIEEILADFGL